MADVFISYKKEDRPQVERIAKAIEGAGFSVWWDDRIRPQGEWDSQIEKEINEARATVVLWTPLSVQSRWVRAEAHSAHDRGRLLPAMLETCDIPIAFSLAQTANLVGWNGDPEQRQFRKLLAWVEDLVHSGGEEDGTDAPGRSGPQVSHHGVVGRTAADEDILDGLTVTSHTPNGTLFRDAEVTPVMRVIPSGSFLMGATSADKDARSTEFPAKLVVFSRPFAIGMAPVTQDEWTALFPSVDIVSDGRLPIVNISWDDAQDYVDRLCEKTGEVYRLPSEAEWEYACRAGISGPFGLLDPIGPDVANYDSTISFNGSKTAEGPQGPSPVCGFAANRFGLHDMHGNVREWVEDRWHDNYFELPDGGLAWTTGYSPMHVVRGGSWIDPPALLRSSARARATRSDASSFIGFRVVRELV